MAEVWASSVPITHFEELFSRTRDPFDLEERWYERRKRALTLAVLARESYPRALELACAEGAMTRRLASRCDQLLALDGSATALSRAAERLADAPGVTFQQLTLPAPLPHLLFDLVVMSEIGYYLVPADLEQLIDQCVAALRPGGELVAVHWRHHSADYPIDGDLVHEQLHEQLDRHHLHLGEVTQPDFLIDSWTRT